MSGHKTDEEKKLEEPVTNKERDTFPGKSILQGNMDLLLHYPLNPGCCHSGRFCMLRTNSNSSVQRFDSDEDREWKQKIMACINTGCILSNTTEISIADVSRAMNLSHRYPYFINVIIRVFDVLCKDGFLTIINSTENDNRNFLTRTYKVTGGLMFGHKADEEKKLEESTKSDEGKNPKTKILDWHIKDVNDLYALLVTDDAGPMNPSREALVTLSKKMDLVRERTVRKNSELPDQEKIKLSLEFELMNDGAYSILIRESSESYEHPHNIPSEHYNLSLVMIHKITKLSKLYPGKSVRVPIDMAFGAPKQKEQSETSMGQDLKDVPDELSLEDISRKIDCVLCRLDKLQQTQKHTTNSLFAIGTLCENLVTREEFERLYDQLEPLTKPQRPKRRFYSGEEYVLNPSTLPGSPQRGSMMPQALIEDHPLAQIGIWSNIVYDLRNSMVELWDAIEDAYRSENASFIIIKFAPYAEQWPGITKPGSTSENYVVCSISSDKVELQKHEAFSPLMNEITKGYLGKLDTTIQQLKYIVNTCTVHRMDMAKLTYTLKHMMYYLVGPGRNIQIESFKNDAVIWTIMKK